MFIFLVFGSLKRFKSEITIKLSSSRRPLPSALPQINIALNAAKITFGVRRPGAAFPRRDLARRSYV